MQSVVEVDTGIATDDQAEIVNAGIKAYTRICDLWQLKSNTAASLLDVETRTWNRMKAGTWSGN